jgi:DNA polymerase-3 subunit epsilon
MINTSGYAIVDVETTGLFPGGSDRIVEIAVIRLNNDGQVIDEYTSLVNPQRDVGPTHIHGITSADILSAPTFVEIVGDVIERIRGTAFVAHNASFDRRFLSFELGRLNCELPNLPYLCTMQLSKKADPRVPGRRLDVLCNYFGIPLKNAHRALTDAEATTELFKTCVECLGGWYNIDPKMLCIRPLCTEVYSWPNFKPSGICYCRSNATEKAREQLSYISKLVSKLPAGSSDDPTREEYLALLDRILEDRRVDQEEFQQMELLAIELGISKEQAITAHYGYMRNLMLVALDDGIVTASEEADLEKVRVLLGLSHKQYRALMLDARQQFKAGVRAKSFPGTPSDSISGKSVCFTGTLSCSVNGKLATRSMAQQAAIDAGMNVQKNVTKSLDILVLADPDSLSSKARKARQYGTRIIVEAVFWAMVGVKVY